MVEYKGLSGKSYRIQNAPFAGGGEGDIYDVVGAPSYAAKVYKPDKRTTERERKLSVMVSNQPSVMEQYAWPLDVLYENGQFVGYIMPKINGKEKLRNIYVYDNRKGKPWSLFIAIAKNLSAAVYNVHEIHQVIGDLNPDNILVNPNDGMVTLVDTDSYHIFDSHITYRCGVCMPEFVAPELQGIDVRIAPLPTFTPETDCFALAVLIFALLMNGAHPFACKAVSGSLSQFQQVDNIKSGICAFFPDRRSNNIDIPLYAPDLGSLPDNIQKLFRRAFVSGLRTPSLRPSAEEWYNALEQLEDSLKTCLKNSQHIYYYGAEECPWCKVNEKMHSISQSAFNSSISSSFNFGSGSQPVTASGQAQQFTPSNYIYTPSSGGGNTPTPKKRYSGWVALVVAIIVLILIVRSCGNSSHKLSNIQTTQSAQSLDTQIDSSNTGNAETSQSEQTSTAVVSEPVASVLNIDPIEASIINIPEYGENDYYAESTDFLYYSGTINGNGQENTYNFVAPETGKYRCELSDMVNGFTVSMYLYDVSGSKIDYNKGISNGDGITVSLMAGQPYTLSVESSSGIGSYNVFIGQQKSTVDLSQYTIVHDSTEYSEQEVNYLYTPAIDGIYRFYISQINNGITVSMYIYDSAGYKVDYNTNIGQDSGVTVTLESGQTYTVVIKQYSNLGSYTMNIGPQQPIIDISDCTLVTDCMKFSDQTNNYDFTAKESGIYRFQMEQINSGITTSLYLYDSAGYQVDYNTNIGKGSGITVSLDADQTYLLQVKQFSNYGAYTISIGSQKETVDISDYDQIKDSIQFNGQVNVYIFKPRNGGTYTFRIEGVASGIKVSVYIYDDADYSIDYNTNMEEGDSLRADLEADRTYYVQVEYSSDYGDYTLNIS